MPPDAPRDAPPDALRETDAAAPAAQDPHATLLALVRQGLDRLPQPGAGATLERWQALAVVAAHDLSLVKLYEGHTDALAIAAELGAPADTDADGGTASVATYGTWAAEAPGQRVRFESVDGRQVRLHGVKCWCSGAASVSHGVLTAWPDVRGKKGEQDGDAGPQLVRVAMRQPGVTCRPDAWRAVGMAASASIDVVFDGAAAELIGGPGDYLRRPGFWHGGAGIAACWFGGAQALGTALHRALHDGGAARATGFRLAALGRVDLALHATAALLREAAAWIDAHPRDDAHAVALRTRLAAEACSQHVLAEAGRALGAAPFCRDAHFARLAADLPVFIRQSHADVDLAALGSRVVAAQQDAWSL